jgi:hypothetical protein
LAGRQSGYKVVSLGLPRSRRISNCDRGGKFRSAPILVEIRFCRREISDFAVSSIEAEPKAESLHLPAPVSPLARVQSLALVLTYFQVFEIRVDAGLILVDRALIIGAWISRWRIRFGDAAAAGERKRAKRDNHPRHRPRPIEEAVSGAAG